MLLLGVSYIHYLQHVNTAAQSAHQDTHICWTVVLVLEPPRTGAWLDSAGVGWTTTARGTTSTILLIGKSPRRPSSQQASKPEPGRPI